MEDLRRKEPKQFVVTNGLNQQNSEVGKISFKSEVSHSSKYRGAAVLWIGEVEDVQSIDELISASVTGTPPLDFKNLDLKIASGLRKILTGNFKKQVTKAEGKAQSEKRSFTSRQIG